MAEFIGVIGAILLALCGVPQAIKSVKDKHSYGISWWFILMWFGGEIFVLIYVVLTSCDWILISNYIMNILLIIIILYYKILPKVERTY